MMASLHTRVPELPSSGGPDDPDLDADEQAAEQADRGAANQEHVNELERFQGWEVKLKEFTRL